MLYQVFPRHVSAKQCIMAKKIFLIGYNLVLFDRLSKSMKLRYIVTFLTLL